MFTFVQYFLFIILLFFFLLIVFHFTSAYKKSKEGLTTTSFSIYDCIPYTLSNGNTLSNLLTDIINFNQSIPNVYSYFSNIGKNDLIDLSIYFKNAVNQSYSNEHKLQLLDQIMISFEHLVNVMYLPTTSYPTTTITTSNF